MSCLYETKLMQLHFQHLMGTWQRQSNLNHLQGNHIHLDKHTCAVSQYSTESNPNNVWKKKCYFPFIIFGIFYENESIKYIDSGLITQIIPTSCYINQANKLHSLRRCLLI